MTLLGKNEQKSSAALEDITMAADESYLATTVLKSIDIVHSKLGDLNLEL